MEHRLAAAPQLPIQHRPSQFLSLVTITMLHVLVFAWLYRHEIRIGVRQVARVMSVTVALPEPLPVAMPPPPPRAPQALPPTETLLPAPEKATLPSPNALAIEPPRAAPAADSQPIAPTTSSPAIVERAPAPLTPPDFEATYLSNPPPDYPAISRRLGEQGRVLLRVHVLPGGRVDKLEVHRSSGSERLDKAALEAVSRWRFIPAHIGELAVAAWVFVPINFSLES